MQKQDLIKELDSLNSNVNSKKKYIYIGSIILIVTFIAFILNFASKKENKNEYITSKVINGDLTVVVNTTGTLKPTNTVEIGIEVSGTLKEIFVDYNDQVKKGQILAVIDTVKLQSQVDSSSASLKIALANEKESEVSVKSKKIVYDRMLSMYEKTQGKYPSKNDLEESKFSYEAALESLKASKGKVLQAQSNLKTDKQNLEKAYVKSSIDGIVLDRDVEVGQTLAAAMSAPKLFTIAKDLTKMDLIVNIDEADVSNIKKDLPVSFTVDAYGNKEFYGHIKQVRLNATNTNGVVTYETVVDVDNKELLLRPGMTSTAKIITKDLKDQILVPNSAFRFQPKIEIKNESNMLMRQNPSRPKKESKDLQKTILNSLYILENNIPKKIMVKVLDTDGKFTSIQSDILKVGDEVITLQKSNNGK